MKRIVFSCARILCLFVLCTVVITYAIRNLSAAWFATNEEATAGGASLTVVDSGIVESVNYFRVTQTVLVDDGGGENHNEYLFSTAEGALGERESFSEPIALNPYSDLEGNAQVLLEIVFRENAHVVEAGSITLVPQTDTTTYFGDELTSKTAAKQFTIDPNGNNPISSVIRYWVIDSVNTVNTGFGRALSITSSMLEAVGENSFVNGTDSLTFSVPAATTSTLTDRTLYILFDYNTQAVEDINGKVAEYVDAATDENGDYDTIVLGETVIRFVCDFKFEIKEGGR